MPEDVDGVSVRPSLLAKPQPELRERFLYWEFFQRGSLDDLFVRPERSTLDYLRGRGFSERMIDRFFRPFFEGIFLERNSARRPDQSSG